MPLTSEVFFVFFLYLTFLLHILKDHCIDKQHAVIEYSQDEDCFVLHDLNSAQGTYVNNCRVQNSAVRLAPGDFIRFGYNSKMYELLVDNNSKVCILVWVLIDRLYSIGIKSPIFLLKY